MSHGGGMDMGGEGCSTKMLWNWDTIDACFLAESWHIKSEGMMAATCIGLFLLTIVLEAIRRAGKEYDRFILGQFQRQIDAQAPVSKMEDNCGSDGPQTSHQAVIFRATPMQQLIRSVIHAVAFGIAYILMLIAMAFNGYVIIVIIIGAGFGKFVCDWMTQKMVVGGAANASRPLTERLESSEEPTMCCG
ncbi:ctr copper transporter [Nemania sp. NC0429]|nr:ctr copper transporter [Nemania sp. NC0429]